MPIDPKRRRPRGAGAVLVTLLASLAFSAPAQAGPGDPLFIFSPQPPPPPAQVQPPPTGYLNDPCGLAMSATGRLFISDHYHRVIDAYNFSQYEDQPLAAKTSLESHLGPLHD